MELNAAGVFGLPPKAAARSYRAVRLTSVDVRRMAPLRMRPEGCRRRGVGARRHAH